jgi:biotin synthase
MQMRCSARRFSRSRPAAAGKTAHTDPQSALYDAGVEADKLMDVSAVRTAAEAAVLAGATRFCVGAAWREPKDRDIEKVAELVRAVKSLGLEACCTIGMLSKPQAQALKAAGVDYYNHDLDTAPEAYGRIISTRVYEERLQTLAHVREVGMRVCCGRIVGMGESRRERLGAYSNAGGGARQSMSDRRVPQR